MMVVHARKLLLVLFLFYSIPAAFAQQTERQLVLTFPDTSYVNTDNMWLTIDTAGNYCYYKSRGPTMVVTNTQTYGPFTSPGDKYTATIFYNKKGSGQYIKGHKSTTLYGPVDGEVQLTNTIDRNYFAYTTQAGDSVRYYVNGTLVATTDTDAYVSNAWCTFSANGNVLYTIKHGRRSYLFLNNKVIDSSEYDHAMLEVDDENCYRYAMGIYEPVVTGCGTRYDFKPGKHEDQKIFGRVAAQKSVFRQYDGATYYYGSGNGTAYTIENDSLYKQTGGFIAPGKSRNFLSYKPNYAPLGRIKDSVTKMNVNGTELQLPYSEIFTPCMDAKGNYALFGLRDYHLYKNVNGVEQKQPLSKYGVRADAISIDTKGNTICYYETDDSVYTYENDRLFGKCALRKFRLLRSGEVMPAYTMSGYNDLSGFCIDSACYIVYNNTISPPIAKPIYHSGRDSFMTGTVICGNVGDYGYWILQKAGYRKYNLIINNRSIALPPEVDFDRTIWYQLGENFVFTGKEFIFYTQQGANIYRYKITL